VQLEAVQVLHPEEPAEERKSPSEADPLLKPKDEKSLLIFFPPHISQQVAPSDVLRA